MKGPVTLAALAVTGAALTTATTAHAAFHWGGAADPSCPSAAEVDAAAQRAAGPGPGVDVDAHATARRVQDHYELHLETRDAAGVVGERDLQGDTCAQVADAAALVLALARSSARSTPVDTESGPADIAAAESSSPIGIALRPMVGGSVGVLPGAALGFGLAAAITRGRWRVEAQGEGWIPRTADAPRAGTGGSVDLVGGGLRGCFLPVEGLAARVDLSVCTGPSVGDEFGHGVGLRTTRTGGGLWAAWMFGLRGGLRLGSRFSLQAAVEAGPRMVAPTFVSDSSGTLFEASAAEGRAWLGLEIELR